jgi:hypothetical protein
MSSATGVSDGKDMNGALQGLLARSVDDRYGVSRSGLFAMVVWFGLRLRSHAAAIMYGFLGYFTL